MNPKDCDGDCLSCNSDIYISCAKRINPNTRPENAHSSEPPHVKINNGSDRDWRLISMYELQKLEYAINEECVGRNDGCPPGHLKEMHDSGNEVIDKVRNRQTSIIKNMIAKVKEDERNHTLNEIRDIIDSLLTGEGS
jgi:hypothetical protein